MRDTELAAFQSEGEEESEDPQSGQVLPETAPESLLDGFIPPVSERVAVAPEHPKCTVQTGDLLVIHVGDEAMEYYGFLILEIYANKLVGINLHNQTYGVRELDSWVEWYEEYQEAGDFDAGTKRIYSDIAPVGEQVEGSESVQTTHVQESETVEG